MGRGTQLKSMAAWQRTWCGEHLLYHPDPVNRTVLIVARPDLLDCLCTVPVHMTLPPACTVFTAATLLSTMHTGEPPLL
jgi:hypothetical protein